MQLKTIQKYVSTLRHLKLKQLSYRLLYASYKPTIKQSSTQTVNAWLQSWEALEVMSASFSCSEVTAHSRHPSACSQEPVILPRNSGPRGQAAGRRHCGEQACSGNICFLNETGTLEEENLWNNPERSKLWLYNLHYFDDLNAKDSANRLGLASALIARWVDENPLGQGNGWEPYPISLRVVNWIKWFSKNPNCVEPFGLESLVRQVCMLEKRIEYHILANHLFANAKALVFAGAFFEGKLAQRWLKKGLRILDSEIKEQFLSDGGHFERSPMYHATLLWDVCDLYNLASCSGIKQLVERQLSWQGIIVNGLKWLDLMSHPDGEISFFNDATFGIAPNFSNLAGYASFLGIDFKAQPTGSVWGLSQLEQSGFYVVCKDGKESSFKAILDVGPIGPDYQPGHAHADTLSFELSLFGQRFIVNSGISEYGLGELRQFQRSTKAHNTVCINDEDSSEVWAGFRVARRAKPFDLEVNECEEGIQVACSHNGYARLSGKNTHRRTWHFEKEKLVVSDCISGYFERAEARFYLHPDMEVEGIDEKSMVCRMPGRQKIKVSLKGKGRLNLISTMWYPAFGVSEKNQCIVCYFDGDTLDTQIEWLC